MHVSGTWHVEVFFFSSRRRHTRCSRDWSSDVCSSDLNVKDFLGVLKYREFWLEKQNEVGLTTGLAWTEVGGSVLATEATLMEGKGRRSEEHTSELQSRLHLVCRLLLEKKKKNHSAVSNTDVRSR